KSAPAIAAILPQMPEVPRRCGSRLAAIICQPEPALCQDALLRRAHLGTAKSLTRIIFAGINPRIFAGPLVNPFDECHRLIDPHRAARIMTVLFEIEHQQDTV